MAIGANNTIELAPTFKIWSTHAEHVLIFPINVRLLPPKQKCRKNLHHVLEDSYNLLKRSVTNAKKTSTLATITWF